MSFKGFTTVELRKPQRSFFDMSHDRKMTIRAGQLVPAFVTEAIPGDTWTLSAQVLMRMMALLAPVYARFRVSLHCFFVPNRLLWSEWEDFITTGRLGLGGAGQVQPVPPNASIRNLQQELLDLLDKGSLADYLGVPTVADAPLYVNNVATLDLMPFLAYQQIWFDYYRDRNFIPDTEGVAPAESGSINVDLAKYCSLRIRDWSRNDYFTSALPFTQRGAEVLIPMEGSVTYLPASNVERTDASASGTLDWETTAFGRLAGLPGPTSGASTAARIENIDTIENTNITINDLRSAMRLQEWLERNAVGGSRYTESIQAHFGVRPQDSRLQRAEFIGGGILPVKISEVVNTAFSENEALEVVPAGNLAGHGIAYGNNGGFRYYVHEHGFIMCILSVTSIASYQQGLPRMFQRRSFLDYPWPEFGKLGEQEVHNYELFMDETSMTPDVDGNFPLFGYQSRYADWKFMTSTSHGDFRDTLIHWTQTRTFANQPVLGGVFLSIEPTLQDRIFAVPGNNFLVYVYNKCSVQRSLPYFGTPSL